MLILYVIVDCKLFCFIYSNHRFPRAGMPNAESTLRLLEVELSSSDDLRVTTRHLRHDLKVLAPWYEYLVRIGWTPDGSQ